jgi:hypothetical protein
VPAGGDWTAGGCEIACRASLVVLLAVTAHQFAWGWLRFLTSEAVLRLSGILGVTATRVSFDVIALPGARFEYVTACIFVDVFLASIPLIWDLRRSLTGNAIRVVVASGTLFALNVVRLEMALLLYCHGIRWCVADGVVGVARTLWCGSGFGAHDAGAGDAADGVGVPLVRSRVGRPGILTKSRSIWVLWRFSSLRACRTACLKKSLYIFALVDVACDSVVKPTPSQFVASPGFCTE